MFSLIIILLFSLAVVFFSQQNTLTVPINFFNYRFEGVPLYFLIIISVVAGIIMAWILSTVDAISYRMRIRRGEHRIKDDRRSIEKQDARIRDLESENAKLKERNKKESPRLFSRISEKLPTTR